MKNYQDLINAVYFASLLPPRYFKSKCYSTQLDVTKPESADSKRFTRHSLTQPRYALCLQGNIFQFEYTEVQRISQEVRINDVGCFDVLAGQVDRDG